MNLLVLYEYDISLEKIENTFNTQLEYIDCDLMTEGVLSDITSKIKKVIIKYINVFILFNRDLTRLVAEYKATRQVEEKIKIIEKAIETCPSIAKEKVIIKGREEDDHLECLKYANNVATRIFARTDSNPRLYNLLVKYEDLKDNRDTKEETIEYALGRMQSITKEMHFLLEIGEKKFKDSKARVEKASKLDTIQCDVFKKNLKEFQECMVNSVYNFFYNMESLFYAVNRAVKKDLEKNTKKLKVKKVPNFDKIIEESEFYKEMKVNGVKFKLYKMKNHANESCFNYEGHSIFLDDKFFDYPVGYQKAIIYHEIGHTMKGHFDYKKRHIIFDDEEAKLKQIKKDTKKFDKLVSKSLFSPSECLNDDSELLYILMELDADRYAANVVGKKLLRNALTTRFKDSLDSVDMDDELKEFNMERMKFRTKMI